MFDPYHKWLGIAPQDQPPNHYRLLGLNFFESDLEVIEIAANKQMAYLQSCTGPEVAQAQKLLNEIAAARLCLLDPKKKAAYDAKLKENTATFPKITTEKKAKSIVSAEKTWPIWTAAFCVLLFSCALGGWKFGWRPQEQQIPNPTTQVELPLANAPIQPSTQAKDGSEPPAITLMPVPPIDKAGLPEVKAVNPPSENQLVAEWVLGMGAKYVTVRSRGEDFDQQIESTTQLPTKVFDVIGISLDGNRQLTDSDLSRLRTLKKLQHLNLWDTNLTDDGMPDVCTLTNLKHLTIGKTRVTDNGLDNIHHLRQLTTLNIAGLKVTDRSMAHIATLTKLEKLFMGGLQISDTGLEELKGLTNLKFLGLVDNSKVTDAGIGNLQTLQQLELIRLDRTKVSAEAVKLYLPKCRIERSD